MCEKVRAAAQRFDRPFVDVAAYIRRRIYKMRTKRAFVAAVIADAAFSRMCSGTHFGTQ
jgi:hypothetical protein